MNGQWLEYLYIHFSWTLTFSHVKVSSFSLSLICKKIQKLVQKLMQKLVHCFPSFKVFLNSTSGSRTWLDTYKPQSLGSKQWRHYIVLPYQNKQTNQKLAFLDTQIKGEEKLKLCVYASFNGGSWIPYCWPHCQPLTCCCLKALRAGAGKEKLLRKEMVLQCPALKPVWKKSYGLSRCHYLLT